MDMLKTSKGDSATNPWSGRRTVLNQRTNRKDTIDEKEQLQKEITTEFKGLEEFLKYSDTFLIIRTTETLLLKTQDLGPTPDFLNKNLQGRFPR